MKITHNVLSPFAANLITREQYTDFEKGIEIYADSLNTYGNSLNNYVTILNIIEGKQEEVDSEIPKIEEYAPHFELPHSYLPQLLKSVSYFGVLALDILPLLNCIAN